MMELSAPPLLALAAGVWLERKLMKQREKRKVIVVQRKN